MRRTRDCTLNSQYLPASPFLSTPSSPWIWSSTLPAVFFVVFSSSPRWGEGCPLPLFPPITPTPSFPTPSFFPPCQVFIFRTSESFPSLWHLLSGIRKIFHFSFLDWGWRMRLPQERCLPFWRQSWLMSAQHWLCQWSMIRHSLCTKPFSWTIAFNLRKKLVGLTLPSAHASRMNESLEQLNNESKVTRQVGWGGDETTPLYPQSSFLPSGLFLQSPRVLVHWREGSIWAHQESGGYSIRAEEGNSKSKASEQPVKSQAGTGQGRAWSQTENVLLKSPTPKLNPSDHKNVHITDNCPCTRHSYLLQYLRHTSFFISTTILPGRHCYNPHFIEEEAEVQRG